MFKKDLHNILAIIILILITKATLGQNEKFEHFVFSDSQKVKIEKYLSKAEYERFETHYKFIPFKNYKLFPDTNTKRWILPYSVLNSKAFRKRVHSGWGKKAFNEVFLVIPIVDTKKEIEIKGR